MDLLNSAILRALPWIPRPVIHRVAGRYIAGETLEDLLRVVQSLDRKALLSTVDVLGENVATPEAARSAMEEYLRLARRLGNAKLPSEVSLKLTSLGLRISEELAGDCVETIVDEAEKSGISVCLDMEDSSTTDAAIRIFRRVRRRRRIAMAIQAYLKRSEEDLKSILPLAPALRVCKGIYNEPPEIAFQDRSLIRESFLRLVTLLLDGGGYPAIATHDPWLVDRCLRLLKERKTGPDAHEFQMLLGVGDGLRPRILQAGSKLRLYCPYGPDWYAYSLRRLKENPRMAGYVFKGLFKRPGAR